MWVREILRRSRNTCFVLFFSSSREEVSMSIKSWVLIWTWRGYHRKFYTLLTSVHFFYPSGGLADSKIIGADTKKMSQLHSWLHSRLQSPSKSYWSLCYRASSHGWSGSTFHSRCDNRGPTVTIIRAHGYIFGGYTDNSWISKFLNCIHIWLKKNWRWIPHKYTNYVVLYLKWKRVKNSQSFVKTSAQYHNVIKYLYIL